MKFFHLLFITFIFGCPIFAQNLHNSWLQGIWEGNGVQNDGASWSMKLSVTGGQHLIEYPSLNCRGYWNLSSIKTNKAQFLERIPNSSVCLDKLIIRIEKINEQQLKVRFSSAVDKFTATAVLRRVEGARGAPDKQVLPEKAGNEENSRKSSSEDLLIDYEKQTWELAQRKELDKFAAFIADDFSGIYPDTENVTKAQLMQSLGAIEIKNYELTDFKAVMLNKDAAIINYKASSKVVADGKEIAAQVALTAGWARRDGKWQIVFFRETSLK